MADITGTDSGETLDGTPLADTINALGGDDVINAGQGNDVIDGGTGVDTANFAAGGIFYETGTGWGLSGSDGADFFSNVEIAVTGTRRHLLVGATAFSTIQQALDAAQSDDFVRIAFGSFTENVSYDDPNLQFVSQSGGVLNLTISTTTNFGITIYAGDEADRITSGVGNDVLIGGGGNDVLAGGLGDDIYRAETNSDVINEAVGEGFDVIYTIGSYTLLESSEIEALVAIDPSGTAGITLIGNDFDNTIYGNAGRNTLIGNGGIDQLIGGAGNDIYRGDLDDIILESPGGGFDVIYTALASYSIRPGSAIEALVPIDQSLTTALHFMGNEVGNIIYGNAGANTLIGNGGNDELIGGAGNDDYRAEAATDIILENVGGGSDAVYTLGDFTLRSGSEIEALVALDPTGTAALTLIGNEFANVIYGNAGANVINGRLGADQFIGLGGADVFQFTTALGPSNVDALLDFTSGTDRIALDDAIFSALGPPGLLNPNAFYAGTAAHEADDRLIYNQASGHLYYDADGNGSGAQVLFAFLPGQMLVTWSDFTVI